MRLGIFSDTHANYEALSAVLEAYRKERIDIYYCLGDTVGYGGSPNECCDLIRELCKSTILGNHDAAVSGRMDYSYYYEAARHALDAHAAMLSEENMAWLKALPYQEKLDDCDVLLCHGSPMRLEDFEYIFALEPDKKYIVSVGSVGQPRDFDNRASYTVYDTTKKRFEFKRIEYDIELAADKVLRARLERNFAHRLFIGV